MHNNEWTSQDVATRRELLGSQQGMLAGINVVSDLQEDV